MGSAERAVAAGVRRALPEALDLALYASAIHFSVMSLIVDALPARDVVVFPASLRVTLVAFYALFTLAVYAADRAIARAWGAGAARNFRAAAVAVACVLVAQRLELHLWGAERGYHFADVVQPLVAVAARLAVIAGIAYAAWRWQRFAASAFRYLFVVAVLVTMYWWSLALRPDHAYADAPAAAVTDAGRGPVVVIVFDALSYDSLLDGSGHVDAERYPNFARLADESLTYTNATSNYFHTWLQLPALIDGATSIAADRPLVLYEQTAAIERIYAPGCGRQYECHGASYQSHRHQGRLFAEVLVRGLRNATPDDLDPLFGDALNWLTRRTQGSALREDRFAVHEYSPDMLDTFIDDLAHDDGQGRIYFVHTLLPHPPYIFTADGRVSRDAEYEFPWLHPEWPTLPGPQVLAAYEQQVGYADASLGRVLDALERDGSFDRATLLVTADHGLREDEPARGERQVDDLMTRVPLLVHAPGLPVGSTDVDYQHIDFAPTLAALAGVSAHPAALTETVALEGSAPRSALGAGLTARTKTFFVYQPGGRYLKFSLAPGAAGWDFDGMERCDIGDRSRVLDRRPLRPAGAGGAGCEPQPLVSSGN
ncbi:MAG TPA: sulfatase-like hydrolase/transferase [Dehalococcoidia bacterium]|nr:sulfatase-like hydrolase/transferase [Dehalococcoidia bacterium]